MNIPKQTAEIFNILSKGYFLSSNGMYGKLYELIELEDNAKILKEYFGHINYQLEKGYNYYYFTQEEETNTIIEKKLEQFAHCIDVLDFFSCMDIKPVAGTRYRITQIAEECFANERLRQKLFSLSRRDKLTDKVMEVVGDLTVGGFFEQEDEDTFKVMDAIHYLEQIISLITIEEDGKNQNS